MTAIFGMGVVLGPVFAPTLGGYLSEAFSWRWVFFMMVPVASVVFVGILVFVRVRDEAGQARLDWTGFLALALAIAAFQFMLDRGERQAWFESTEIILEAALAVAAFYFFLVHILTSDNPFVNPKLFLNRNFSVGLMLTIIFGMVNFTPMVLLPILLSL